MRKLVAFIEKYIHEYKIDKETEEVIYATSTECENHESEFYKKQEDDWQVVVDKKAEELLEDIKKYNLNIKSPYSASFYDKEVDWGNKPDGSYRLSDHWNFYTGSKTHCETECGIMHKVALGKYDAETGKYKIIKVYN